MTGVRPVPASGAGLPSGSGYAVSVLSALLEARTGQQLASYRSWRLDVALTPLLRAHGLSSLDGLVALLAGGRAADIDGQIVDAILNGETSFFRDAAMFAMLDQALAARHDPAHRIRLWSAGCATGQEALSLAMMLAEGGRRAQLLPEVVGTDISAAALGRAKAARYTQFEIQRGLPIRSLLKWFDEVDGDWRARPELIRRVQYRRLNLVADAPPPGRFDAVLCRNVLLYLSPAAKARALVTLAAATRPGGLLLLGAGEAMIGQTDLFVPSIAWRGLYERTDVAACPAAA